MSLPRPTHAAADPWSRRWAQLARGVELGRQEPLLLALSGGADSVLLLHLVCAAVPRPRLLAVHVDHGLRGAESDRDAEFCRDLCRSLDVPIEVRRMELDPAAPGLEARAREARYRSLASAARAAGFATLITGHHGDDGLETLLLRWMRGSGLPGLRGPRARSTLHGEFPGQPPELRPPGLAPLEIVRPLLPLRREEVRRLLESRGLSWVEDSSNQEATFDRNRVRHHLLPALERAVGPGATAGLHAFAQTVERLERDLADHTAHLCWRTPGFAAATRSGGEVELGGVLPRAELMRLERPVARRALWRLLTEGSGRAPSRALLERVLADLSAGRCALHTTTDGWSLQLRSSDLRLLPPGRLLPAPPRGLVPEAGQLELPFGATAASGPAAVPLPVPGFATLPDGRRILAEVLHLPPSAPIPREAERVELDADRIPAAGPWTVRAPRPGDRFHPLGGPGSRPLRRFLADSGVPRGERSRVPLVCAGGQILWAAGLRPAQAVRIGGDTRRRIRLTLWPR